MKFKRKEGFRFVFNEPIRGQYSIYVNGQLVDMDCYPCQIIDISPKGMKMSCGAEIGHYISYTTLQIETQFILDVAHIRAFGDIVWSKSFGSSYVCGVSFITQGDLDELIISEMKLRRKKEVLQSKIR